MASKPDLTPEERGHLAIMHAPQPSTEEQIAGRVAQAIREAVLAERETYEPYLALVQDYCRKNGHIERRLPDALQLTPSGDPEALEQAREYLERLADGARNLRGRPPP